MNTTSLAGVTGEYIPTVARVYNPRDPAVRAHLDRSFPKVFLPKPPAMAAEEIHAQNKFFHTVTERNLARQLMEEGRLELDQIEGVGLPESLGELFDWITHPSLPIAGSPTPPGVTVHHQTIAGQTVPTKVTDQSASQKGAEEASKVFGGVPWLQIAELVGGAALVMFGLVQLGQKAGISVPVGRP